MSLMRLFIGLDLPGNLKEKIFVVSQKIGKEIPCKLVEKENLHLTLVFLGERTTEELERIKETLSEVTKGFKNFYLRLGEGEFFPAGRPRGIWLKIEGETDKLRQLHQKIIDCLSKNGIQLKDLRFIPHCCLCRLKGKVEKGMKIEKMGPESRFAAEKITLFESRLSLKGPTYFKLQEFDLE